MNWHPDKIKRFRGAILSLLCEGHNAQRSRMDDVAMAHALQSLAWDVGLNDVLTTLQYMRGRGWITYRELKNRITNRTELSQIELLPDGRDLVEQTSSSDLVLF